MSIETSATLTVPQLEAHFKALRVAGRIDEVRSLLAGLGQRQGAEGAWARRLLAAHDPRWWRPMIGRRCRLRRRGPQDVAFVRRLWAVPQFAERFNAMAPPLPADDDALSRILAHEQAAVILQSRSIHWVAETLAGEPFGVASLADISVAHRRAEFLLGVHEPPYQGATAEATLLAIDFAFGPMQLRKLVGMVPVGNQPSLDGAAHLGFRSEGVLRQHAIHPRTRQPIDFVHMALLADDADAREKQRRARRRLLGQDPAPAGPIASEAKGN